MYTKTIFSYLLLFFFFNALLSMDVAVVSKRHNEEEVPIALKRTGVACTHIYSSDKEGFSLPTRVAFLSKVIKDLVEIHKTSSVTVELPAARLAIIIECLTVLDDCIFPKSNNLKLTFKAMASEELVPILHRLIGPICEKKQPHSTRAGSPRIFFPPSKKFEFIADCIALKIPCLAHYLAHYAVITVPVFHELNPETYPNLLHDDIKACPPPAITQRILDCYTLNRQLIHAYSQSLTIIEEALMLFAESPARQKLNLLAKIPPSIHQLSIETLIDLLLANDFLDIPKLKETCAHLIAQQLLRLNKNIENVEYQDVFGALTEPLKHLIAQQMVSTEPA